jgi:hypothetical protein
MFYQIHINREPSKNAMDWKGPFRDKTDAENAAEDEARDRGICLKWNN